MKYLRSFKLLMLYILALCSFCSCKSMLGVGASYNHGNLLQKPEEKNNSEFGSSFEYRWKNMFEYNRFSDFLSRSGAGFDYNISVKGYSAQYKEGGDVILHTLQGKYYYTLIKPRYNFLRIDLAAGAGFGVFPFLSNTEYALLISNISADIYIKNLDLLYISPKFNYVNNIKDNTYNSSFELIIGIRFHEL